LKSATQKNPTEPIDDQTDETSVDNGTQIKVLSERLEAEIQRANANEWKANRLQQLCAGIEPEKPESEVDRAVKSVIVAVRELANAEIRQENVDLLVRAQKAESKVAELQYYDQTRDQMVRDLSIERDELRAKLNRRY
jgi:hypothetical protein